MNVTGFFSEEEEKKWRRRGGGIEEEDEEVYILNLLFYKIRKQRMPMCVSKGIKHFRDLTNNYNWL